jgi:hypothetical protein
VCLLQVDQLDGAHHSPGAPPRARHSPTRPTRRRRQGPPRRPYSTPPQRGTPTASPPATPSDCPPNHRPARSASAFSTKPDRAQVCAGYPVIQRCNRSRAGGRPGTGAAVAFGKTARSTTAPGRSGVAAQPSGRVFVPVARTIRAYFGSVLGAASHGPAGSPGVAESRPLYRGGYPQSP